MNEPVQMEAAGQSLDIIYVADYANLISNGLITNERTIQQRPELVQAVVRAALTGLAFTLESPDEAFDISLTHVPEAASDAETEAVNRAILDRSVEFWQAGRPELGRSDDVEWQAAQRIMEEMGLIDAAASATADVTTMFTNDFIEEVTP
jgi:NitT/TauT family transport system substrate-binding protein